MSIVLNVTPPLPEDAETLFLQGSVPGEPDYAMTWEKSSSRAELTVVEQDPRALSPISGLTEGISQLRTSTPYPPEEHPAFPNPGIILQTKKNPHVFNATYDKENCENRSTGPVSPKPVSPSTKVAMQLENMVDEEEETSILFLSDPVELRNSLRQPDLEHDAKLINNSLPELPSFDDDFPPSILHPPRNISRNRANTGSPRMLARSRDNANLKMSSNNKKRRSLQKFTKSRPSSPAMSPMGSPMGSPALSRLHASVGEQNASSSLRQRPTRINSLIPSLKVPADASEVNGNGNGKRKSLTKSPSISPRSSAALLHSSEVLLEASPKRSAWTKRSALLRSDSALPYYPAFPLADHNNNNNRPSIPFHPPPLAQPAAVPFPGPGPNCTFGKPSWIQSQLGSLQMEFDTHFLTTHSTSEGDMADEEPEIEEEHSGGIRRTNSAMDINTALTQRKRKYSKRKAHLSMSHCEKVKAEQECQQIPTIRSCKHPDLDVIESKTLVRMLRGEFADLFSEVIVIDCRYPYEFEGGHVQGALNLHLPQHVEGMFPVIRCAQENDKIKKPAIIFHCEFSSERGPKQYRHLRKLDRETNYDLYPRLYYPHLFLLAGGYKEFFLSMEGEMCEPKAYVEMRDARYLEEMKGYMADTKKKKKKRSLKKFRSQSYSCLANAFKDHHHKKGV